MEIYDVARNSRGLLKCFLGIFKLAKTFCYIPTQNFNYAYELSESVKERYIQERRDRERTIPKAKRELPVGFVQCKSRANRGEFLAKMLAVFTHCTSHHNGLRCLFRVCA